MTSISSDNSSRSLPGSHGLDVTTEQGIVRGWRGSVSNHWTAIPYANELTTTRDFFSLPTAPTTYPGGFLDANRHRRGSRHTLSIAAPLGAGSESSATGSDSPSLSIPDAPLPVVVFIHGGRYEMGEADSMWYRGKNFARDNCVYVALNYRLRFEGFLPLADDHSVQKGTSAGQKTTQKTQFRGVEDIFCALDWIHRNIASFGGDPDNVTLMGQSAGGGLTHWVLSDPRSEGLAHRGICLSMGLPREGWSGRVKTARKVLGGPLTMEHVSSLSREELRSAYDAFATKFSSDCAVGPYPWDPVQLRTVPMIMGSMRDEFVRVPFAAKWDEKHSSRNPLTRLAARAVALYAAKALGMGTGVASKSTMAKRVRRIRAYYRHERKEPLFRPLGHLIGDATIRRFVIAALDAQGAKAPTWAYEFHGGDSTVAFGTHHKEADAQHCGDLPLVFDDVKSVPDSVREFCGTNAPKRLQPLASRFHQLVVDFAHGREPDWPQYDPDGERLTKLFDMNDGSESVASDPLRKVRHFFPVR